MAPKQNCLNCRKFTSKLKYGWHLKNTEFAKICYKCYSIYKTRRFCETCHINKEKWENCEFCEKPIHTTCLVSIHKWVQIERGTRVMCMECSKINSFLARNFYNLMDPADGIQTESHYWPTFFSQDPKKASVFLFERVLTDADKEFDFSFIQIPKIHAEAYLPKANQHYAEEFCTEDEDNNIWNVTIRLAHKDLYILENLEEYIISNNLKVGDTVTFSKLVPDEQYQISFRRNHLLDQAST